MAATEPYLPALRFRALTPLFDLVARATTREAEFKRALLSQAQIQPGNRVLDLGAGTGTLALRAKAEHPAAEILGLDADPEILGLARAKAAKADLEVGFDQALSSSMPYSDGAFDRVLSTLFFHHLPPAEKRDTLREVVRILRPGGELHVADFTKPADRLQWLLSRTVRFFDGDTPTRQNLEGEMAGLIASAGLQEVEEPTRFRTPVGTIGLFSAVRR